MTLSITHNQTFKETLSTSYDDKQSHQIFSSPYLLREIFFALSAKNALAMSLCNKAWHKVYKDSPLLKSKEHLERVLHKVFVKEQLFSDDGKQNLLETFSGNFITLCKEERAIAFLLSDVVKSLLNFDPLGVAYASLAKDQEEYTTLVKLLPEVNGALTRLTLNVKVHALQILADKIHLKGHLIHVLYDFNALSLTNPIELLPHQKALLASKEQQNEECLTQFLASLTNHDSISLTALVLVQKAVCELKLLDRWTPLCKKLKQQYEPALLQQEQQLLVAINGDAYRQSFFNMRMDIRKGLFKVAEG